MVNKAPIGSSNTGSSQDVDKRVRIRCKPGKESEVYGARDGASNPMAILHDSNGLIFPYTPMIDYKQNPKWSPQELTHFIQQYYYFTAVESAEITITGRFTAQNVQEGTYMLGVFHFLRSYSKMHFGTSENDARRGLPPPVLLLDGYGDFMFNALPIIINSWKFDFPNDVDYVRVYTKTLDSRPLNQPNTDQRQEIIVNNSSDVRRLREAGLSYREISNLLDNQPSREPVNVDFAGYAYVPAITNVTISVTVQQPPTLLKRSFNLQDFREGRLLGQTKGFT